MLEFRLEVLKGIKYVILMKVSFSCSQILIQLSRILCISVAITLTAPHHSESVVVDENFFCLYSVLKFIDFCEGVDLAYHGKCF